MIVNIIVLISVAMLALAVLCVLVVVCSPVRVSVSFNTDRTPVFDVSAVLLGGLGPAFSAGDGRSAKKGPASPRPKKPARTGKRNIRYLPHVLRAMPRLVSRMVKQIKIEMVDADIVFGLSDPADTGVVYGVLTPFTLLVDRWRSSHIYLQPNFDKATLEGRCHLQVCLTPIKLMPPMLTFAWTAFISPRLSQAFR